MSPFRLKHFYLRDCEKGRRPGSLLAHRACVRWGARKGPPFGEHPCNPVCIALVLHTSFAPRLRATLRRTCLDAAAPARFCSRLFTELRAFPSHPSPYPFARA